MKVYVITYHTMLLGEYEETCCHRVFEKKEDAIECLNNMFKEITESEEQYKNQIESGDFEVEKYDEGFEVYRKGSFYDEHYYAQIDEMETQ